ncbi:MAG: response regulator [Porphyrobacter sp. IPPAS B-1204]|nr:MAG: response regulator [Porphyrobacter sp. IPPAS B-1204]
MTDRPLSGYRIIILEDDYYQAEDSRLTLEQAGATVIAVTASAPDLGELLVEGRIDAALIDINLGSSLSFDFARELGARAIPFAFLTGYDAGMLPDDLAGRPCLSKPADPARIIAALARLAGGHH